MRDTRPAPRAFRPTLVSDLPPGRLPMDPRYLLRCQAHLRAALRIVTALLFMEHGLARLVHFPVPQPGLPDLLPTILVTAAYIELIGGGLLAVGLFTRVVALIAAGEIATGYFLFPFSQGFWPTADMGEAAILYCLVFLYLAAAGPGAFSIDAAR